MAKEISASNDILPSHTHSVITAGTPSPDNRLSGDCHISTNVSDVLHEALDDHAGDPAEIIHDVRCVSESQLIATLDTGHGSPPDLQLLASFAEDGLSSTEEIIYDATNDLPSSIYDNLFHNDQGAVDQCNTTDRQQEEAEISTSSASHYTPMFPPPSYPTSTSAHGMSILERQLTAPITTSCETTPARMWFDPSAKAKSATYSGNHRPDIPVTYTPPVGFQNPPSNQYSFPGTHQSTPASNIQGSSVILEEPRHCTYLPSGLTVPNLQSSDTYLVPILPKPHYQEMRQPPTTVGLIPRSLVFSSSPRYPFAGGGHLPCLPMYSVLNPRMAIVGPELQSASADNVTNGRPTTYPILREQLQISERVPGYTGQNTEYQSWMPWQKPQRAALYEPNGTLVTQQDNTYGVAGNGISDAFRRAPPNVPNYPPISYSRSLTETVLPDGPKEHPNHSPPRYIPTLSKDPAVAASDRYHDARGDFQVLDVSYRKNGEAEVVNRNLPISQYEAVPEAQAAPSTSKEYLVPLNFKEGGQGTLCSICFPNNVLPPRPPLNAQQPQGPTSPSSVPQNSGMPQARKQRQYITVRQMLLERAQKHYLEQDAKARKPTCTSHDVPQAMLPYAKPPAPMPTNTVTMSYPPFPPTSSTTTSYSQLMGVASFQRPTVVPFTSSAGNVLPPPVYSLANIAPKPQAPLFYSGRQLVQSSQPNVRPNLRMSEQASSEAVSILRAQLLAPLVIPKNAPTEMHRNVLMPKNWMPYTPAAPRMLRQTAALPVMPLPKPQLKVSSSYIAVPSSYRLQLPQLFSPTSKSNEGGSGDGVRPPKHYDLETLKIGTFKVEKLNALRNVNKFKIFFAKRKFAYEFSLENVSLAPNHDAAVPHMAIIDVPFNIVTAIHCNDQEVIIAVCSPPKLFLGCKQNRNGGSMCAGIYFDRDRPTDITNGQLRTSQVHKVCLKRRQAESLRSLLESFDPRFNIILNSPIFEAIAEIEEPTTPIYVSPTETGDKRHGDSLYQGPPAKKHCILEIITPDVTPKVSVTPIVCHCQVSCCSNRCSCMKSKSKCGHTPSGCLCKDCDNPLNQLEEMGLDLEESISDSCLVQGIVSYKGDLHELMKKKLIFRCCGMQTRVENCIPGKVKCPNDACNGRSFRFSWCFLDLRDEIVNPRNHCSACKTCKDPIDLHCQACRKCNPVEGNCTKCPFCGAARGTSFTEQSSVSEVLNRYRQNQQRGFSLASLISKTVDKVIAIPTDKSDLLNLPKIVERLNEKMKEHCVEMCNMDEEENEADKLEEEIPRENNLVIAEEVNIVDSTMPLSDVEVVTTQELSDKESSINI